MRTWVETGHGNFCVRCFVLAAGGLVPDDPSHLGGVDRLPPSFGLRSRAWRSVLVESRTGRGSDG
jgi:hypothetical protein